MHHLLPDIEETTSRERNCVLGRWRKRLHAEMSLGAAGKSACATKPQASPRVGILHTPVSANLQVLLVSLDAPKKRIHHMKTPFLLIAATAVSFAAPPVYRVVDRIKIGGGVRWDY